MFPVARNMLPALGSTLTVTVTVTQLTDTPPTTAVTRSHSRCNHRCEGLGALASRGKGWDCPREDDCLHQRAPSQAGQPELLTAHLPPFLSISRCFSVLLFSVGGTLTTSPLDGNPNTAIRTTRACLLLTFPLLSYTLSPLSNAAAAFLHTRLKNSYFQEVLNIGNWKKPGPSSKLPFPWSCEEGS